MNKIILVALGLSLMVFSAQDVKADTVGCAVPPDHGIYSDDGSKLVGCISKANWDRAVSETSSVQDDKSLVKVARGQKVLTTLGYVDTCPVWFSPMSCVIKKSLFVKFL